VLAGFLCLALVCGNAAWAADDVRRFLVVFEHDGTLPANIQIAAGVKSVLAGALQSGHEVYSEHIDLARFPDPAHADRLSAAMGAKYRGLELDAVLAVGPGALDFVLSRREGFAPGTPVIFGAVSAAALDGMRLPPDARGVVSRFDLGQTVGLARRLQPDAERIVVVTGSASFDRSWLERAQAELPAFSGDLGVSYVSGLTMAGFSEMAAGLDPDTILLVLTVFEDAEGRTFVPREAAATIAAAAAAPTYSVYSSFMGTGALGGYVETFPSIGETMARMALEAREGPPAGAPAVVETVPQPVVDWRQVRRFGIDASLLPPGTERLFYEPTAWERYKPQILLAAVIIILQSATIAALVIQERRRKRIAEELALERLELAHLSRASQLGALSGALAHELNQPLASILANAEAGARLLMRTPPDLAELTEILADIAGDDKRAAGIITQLRRLMVKGDTALEEVDLNQAVAATVALAGSELVTRRTRVDFRPGEPELRVRGNLPQLQQVALNLMLNAAEAMAELPPAERRMVIETRRREDGARELAVADRGRGLSPEMAADAFKPFVSSKADGLGFGLSICRSIAQAHGGTLAFDSRAAVGARIVLTLPAP
jgi:signal transduction histidine kinase